LFGFRIRLKPTDTFQSRPIFASWVAKMVAGVANPFDWAMLPARTPVHGSEARQTIATATRMAKSATSTAIP